MTVDLYFVPYSAPCRAVLLTANYVNVKLNLKLIDLSELDHMNPEFIKINLLHKVPVLVDDAFVLGESRAIMIYLAEKYAPGSSLYPNDLQARALINHRLFFDFGTLYQRFLNYYVPMWKSGAPADPYKIAKLKEALKFLETFLEEQDYVAGPNLTLADISLVTSVTIIQESKIDVELGDNIKRWYERVKTSLPGFHEVVTKNLTDFDTIVRF